MYACLVVAVLAGCNGEKPATRQLTIASYGSTLGIGPDRGEFVCASDAIVPSPVLAYGMGIEVGRMRRLSSAANAPGRR